MSIVLNLCLLFLFLPFVALADETSSETRLQSTKVDLPSDSVESEGNKKVESIYVFGSKDKTFLTPGSAQFLPKEDVKKLDYTDSTRALQAVPGVYIQEEDGLGLRANIGLRGATPHRSKKITLMEDGVLIAPAPYSAPAAYFFPNLLRTDSIEVFKGFSSVIYGPNSIGGALNFTTTPISESRESAIESTIGPVRKYRASTSGPGYLLEATRMDSDGIKTLPGGQDTGFYRNDVLLKNEFKLGKKHKVSTKFSYSWEESNETYLGLSSRDFADSPYSRYAASSRDQLSWNHRQFQVRHNYKASTSFSMDTVAYHHDFDRSWSKLNGFRNGVPLSDYIDRNSENYDEHFFQTLKGTDDSLLANGDDYLLFGNNDRVYLSSGLQVAGNHQTEVGDGYLQTKMGVRLHQDQIRRRHTIDTYKMSGGQLVLATDEFEREPGAQNRDRAQALTYFVNQEYDFSNGWLMNWGGRYEYIDTERRDFTTATTHGGNQQVIAPGVGLQFSPTSKINLIAGVNQGVSAIAPGQDTSIDPEESINYEAGIKYRSSFTRLEVIGFLSDYQNIKGFCSFSSGCEEANLDREFNGGKANIYGLESSLSSELSFKTIQFPFSASYTYTVAQFDEALESESNEWGKGFIRKGDPLPYIPESKISLSAGANYKQVAGVVRYNWQSRVYDQAVQENRKEVPSYSFVDIISKYKYSKSGEVLLSIDNIFDEEYIVSLRPFGARPGKPRSVNLGFKHVF